MHRQAMEKWGYWDYIGPGLSNGQSEIKLAQLEFARPADVAAKYGHNEGVTGLVQVLPSSQQAFLLCCCASWLHTTAAWQQRAISHSRLEELPQPQKRPSPPAQEAPPLTLPF